MPVRFRFEFSLALSALSPGTLLGPPKGFRLTFSLWQGS